MKTNKGQKFFIGRVFRDTITGFRGLAIGWVTYISGCDQVLLSPVASADGTTLNPAQWFDDQRLELITSVKVSLDNSKGNGACDPAPTK